MAQKKVLTAANLLQLEYMNSSGQRKRMSTGLVGSESLQVAELGVASLYGSSDAITVYPKLQWAKGTVDGDDQSVDGIKFSMSAAASDAANAKIFEVKSNAATQKQLFELYNATDTNGHTIMKVLAPEDTTVLRVTKDATYGWRTEMNTGYVSGNLRVDGNLDVAGDEVIVGDTTFSENVTFGTEGGDATVLDTATFWTATTFGVPSAGTNPYLKLEDDIQLIFGTGSDANIAWDGAELDITSAATHLSGTIEVDGNATLSGTADVAGDFAINTNKFTVTAASGNTLVAGTLDATGSFAVNTDKFTVAAASGNTVVAGTLNVTGASTLASVGATSGTYSSTLDVSGAMGVDGDFDVNTNKFTVASASGNTAIAGTLAVTGATGIDGNFDINTNKFTVTAASGNTAIAGTLAVTGATGIDGDFDVNTDKFTVASATGNTLVAGTFTATGAADLNSTLNVAGALTLDGASGSKYITLGSNTETVDVGHSLFVVGGELFYRETTSGGTNLMTQITDAGGLNLGEMSGLTGTTSDSFEINTDGAGSTASLKLTYTDATPGPLDQAIISFNGSLVNIDTATDFDAAVTMQSTLVVTGNVDANAGLDVSGGALTIANQAITQTTGGQVTFAGNVDANGGLDVTGAFTQGTGAFTATANAASQLATTVGNLTLGAAADSDIVLGLAGTPKWTFDAGLVQAAGGGQVTLTGNLDCTNGLDVTGADFSVGGANFSVAQATGNTVVGGTLAVTGAAGIDGNFDIATDKFTVNATSGNTAVAGTLSATGDFAVNTNKFTVTAASGNTLVAGTFTSTGAGEFDSSLGVDGAFRVGAAGASNFTASAAGAIYAASNMEIDGTSQLDGALTANSTADFNGNVRFADDVELELGASGDAFQIRWDSDSFGGGGGVALTSDLATIQWLWEKKAVFGLANDTAAFSFAKATDNYMVIDSTNNNVTFGDSDTATDVLHYGHRFHGTSGSVATDAVNVTTNAVVTQKYAMMLTEDAVTDALEVKHADCTDATHGYKFIGVALDADGTGGESIRVCLGGTSTFVTADTGAWSVGDRVFLDTTAGKVTTDPDTTTANYWVVPIGFVWAHKDAGAGDQDVTVLIDRGEASQNP